MTEESKIGYKNKLFTPKYIIGYLVFALIAYGLFYYFFVVNKSNNYYSSPAPATQYPR